MGFLGVYKAVYDYEPQGENELSITEGDILYVLEKSGEDDWWRAKKKASGDDDDEPVGLIPNNYIEEVGCVLSVWAAALDLTDSWQCALMRRFEYSLSFRGFKYTDCILGTSYKSRPRALRLFQTDGRGAFVFRRCTARSIRYI